MTIDPELLRQIQVEGITDDDYRRVEPKIETVKQMACLSYGGLFIFDFFKMDFCYISSEALGNKRRCNDMAEMTGQDFFNSHTTIDGIDQNSYSKEFDKIGTRISFI